MYPVHSAEDHIKKMKHDCSLAQQLAQTDDFCDWTIISTFYFAIHCIEAYAHEHRKERELEGMGSEESLHRIRERFVERHLKDYFTIYTRLYDKARQSRYDPTYFNKISQIKGYHKKLLDAARKLENII